MYHEAEGFLAATSEWLSLHVDMAQRRVAEMPPPILARLEAVERAQADLPTPPEAGRAIKLGSR